MTSQIGKSDGFTLVELLVTVAVLGALLGLASPAFQSTFRSFSNRAEARRLADTLRLSRERAVLERTKYKVDLEANGYSVSRETEPGRFNPVSESLKRRKASQRVAFKSDASEIFFYPDGTASAASLEVSIDDDIVRLSVDPWMGKVTLHENL